MKIFNKIIGNQGELAAQKYLKKQGYKILQTNFSCNFGEIDIIARQKKCIVFVEVKTKTSLNFGHPREMVNLKKQNKIAKVAEYYLIKNKLTSCECRCDVIEVLDGKVTHIQGCF